VRFRTCDPVRVKEAGLGLTSTEQRQEEIDPKRLIGRRFEPLNLGSDELPRQGGGSQYAASSDAPHFLARPNLRWIRSTHGSEVHRLAAHAREEVGDWSGMGPALDHDPLEVLIAARADQLKFDALHPTYRCVDSDVRLTRVDGLNGGSPAKSF